MLFLAGVCTSLLYKKTGANEGQQEAALGVSQDGFVAKIARHVALSDRSYYFISEKQKQLSQSVFSVNSSSEANIIELV